MLETGAWLDGSMAYGKCKHRDLKKRICKATATPMAKMERRLEGFVCLFDEHSGAYRRRTPIHIDPGKNRQKGIPKRDVPKASHLFGADMRPL